MPTALASRLTRSVIKAYGCSGCKGGSANRMRRTLCDSLVISVIRVASLRPSNAIFVSSASVSVLSGLSSRPPESVSPSAPLSLPSSRSVRLGYANRPSSVVPYINLTAGRLLIVWPHFIVSAWDASLSSTETTPCSQSLPVNPLTTSVPSSSTGRCRSRPVSL